MTNLKTIFKQKSKLLLIVLSLLGMIFSYSCSCRNDSTKPPIEEDQSGTFKASVNADGFSDTLIVNSKNEVHNNSALSIGFTGKDGANKVAFEVHITDIVDENADTPLDFSDDKANGYSKYVSYNSDSGALTFTKEGLTKIGGLSSTDAPADRIAKITFQVVADASLNLQNSSTNFTKEFHLIKAQKIDKNNFEKILQKMDGVADPQTGEVPNETKATFPLKGGTYSETGIYEIKNTTTVKKLTSFSEENLSKIHEYSDYYLPALVEIKTATVVNKEGGKDNTFYTVTYNITFADKYESDLTSVKMKFTLN